MAHFMGHGLRSGASGGVLLLVRTLDNVCLVAFAMHPMIIMFVTGSVFVWS
jgi:hypothetical protein